MNELGREELQNIDGGNLSAPMLNAIARGAGLIYSVGNQFGIALRKLLKGRTCS